MFESLTQKGDRVMNTQAEIKIGVAAIQTLSNEKIDEIIERLRQLPS
ncbi:hypothetical protein [Pleurocapsa sp. CCALA 161]|nr:hypothetical protein [Pleurocapsa sp. CCALA 161]